MLRPVESGGMKTNRIEHIDNRIARVEALLKRLRAERQVIILRQKHQQIKFNSAGSAIPKGVYL
jgi:hypothetical protein